MRTARKIWITWKRNPGYLKGLRYQIKNQIGQIRRIMTQTQKIPPMRSTTHLRYLRISKDELEQRKKRQVGSEVGVLTTMTMNGLEAGRTSTDPDPGRVHDAGMKTDKDETQMTMKMR